MGTINSIGCMWKAVKIDWFSAWEEFRISHTTKISPGAYALYAPWRSRSFTVAQCHRCSVVWSIGHCQLDDYQLCAVVNPGGNTYECGSFQVSDSSAPTANRAVDSVGRQDGYVKAPPSFLGRRIEKIKSLTLHVHECITITSRTVCFQQFTGFPKRTTSSYLLSAFNIKTKFPPS